MVVRVSYMCINSSIQFDDSLANFNSFLYKHRGNKCIKGKCDINEL